MHYAVPRILHKQGMLAHFFTDICASKGWPRFLHAIPSAVRPAGLRRLLGRIPHGVPSLKTTTFNELGWRYGRTLARCSTAAETLRLCLSTSEEFARRVSKHSFHGATAVYTFNTAGLEIMQAAKELGLTTFLEQTIAPAAVEECLLQEEGQKHLDWPSPATNSVYAEKIRREYAEWEVADVILCGSEFVKDSITQVGGPTQKCVVVPYGVDQAAFRKHEVGSQRRRLNVLTLGTIGLRKGTPYVLKAAEALADDVTFRLVGPGRIPETVQKLIPSNVEIWGSVPRTDIPEQFAWADILLAPSVCEGSATVTYESIASGVPVVCSRNAGALSSYVCLLDDISADSIVTAIRRLVQDPQFLLERRERTKIGAIEVSLDAYAQRLTRCVQAGVSGGASKV